MIMQTMSIVITSGLGEAGAYFRRSGFLRLHTENERCEHPHYNLNTHCPTSGTSTCHEFKYLVSLPPRNP